MAGGSFKPNAAQASLILLIKTFFCGGLGLWALRVFFASLDKLVAILTVLVMVGVYLSCTLASRGEHVPGSVLTSGGQVRPSARPS